VAREPKNHWELLEMSCQDNIKDTTLRKIEKFTKDSNFTPKLVPTSQFVFADELHHASSLSVGQSSLFLGCLFDRMIGPAMRNSSCLL